MAFIVISKLNFMSNSRTKVPTLFRLIPLIYAQFCPIWYEILNFYQFLNA